MCDMDYDMNNMNYVHSKMHSDNPCGSPYYLFFDIGKFLLKFNIIPGCETQCDCYQIVHTLQMNNTSERNKDVSTLNDLYMGTQVLTFYFW